MIRAALVWLVTATACLGAPPDHGLIRNETGLPLTFPLQVRTTTGQSAYLVLRDAATDEIAVTAYVEGGRYFRLLMPPGAYTLHAALGRDWQGEEALFGAATRFYDHPEVLNFEVAGLNRRTGYLVDLRGLDEMAGVTARPLALCQYYGPGGAASARVGDPPRRAGIAPEIPYRLPLPPGPRDPALDARPELGMEFGNTVADVPLYLRLGTETGRARPAPDDPPRRERRLRQRVCS